MADSSKQQSTNPDAKPVSATQAAKSQEAARKDPLIGVENVGVTEAGGEAAHAELVKSDSSVHEAIPGAKGPEAIGSGQPVPEDAVQAMDDRRAAGVPEPPKVGPIPNVDLYDTPGGYQVVPAGYKPSDLAQAEVRHPGASRVTVEASDAHSEKVAGSGAKTVSE